MHNFTQTGTIVNRFSTFISAYQSRRPSITRSHIQFGVSLLGRKPLPVGKTKTYLWTARIRVRNRCRREEWCICVPPLWPSDVAIVLLASTSGCSAYSHDQVPVDANFVLWRKSRAWKQKSRTIRFRLRTICTHPAYIHTNIHLSPGAPPLLPSSGLVGSTKICFPLASDNNADVDKVFPAPEAQRFIRYAVPVVPHSRSGCIVCETTAKSYSGQSEIAWVPNNKS